MRIHEFVARTPAKDGHEALFLIAVAPGDVDAREYLNRRTELLPKGVDGKMQSLRRTQKGSYGGVELIIVVSGSPPAYCVRYRSFVIDSKVYLVLCRTKDEEAAKGEQAERFFESFTMSKNSP